METKGWSTSQSMIDVKLAKTTCRDNKYDKFTIHYIALSDADSENSFSHLKGHQMQIVCINKTKLPHLTLFPVNTAPSNIIFMLDYQSSQ